MENKVDDREIIKRAKNGDQDAITILYQENYYAVLGAIRSLIRDEDEAMDLLQDTFVKAFSRLEQLKGDSFTPWVKRIGINTAKYYLAKKKPLLFSQMAGEDSSENDTPIQDTFEEESSEGNPEITLDQQETARLMNEILDTLPDEQRIVINLCYYQEISYREIAETLGIPENLVRSRLNLGREKVEKKVLALEKKGTKLYGLAPIPFLLFLYRNMDAQAAGTQPNASVLQNILEGIGKIGMPTTEPDIEGTGKASIDWTSRKNVGNIAEATSKHAAESIASGSAKAAASVAGKAAMGAGTKAVLSIAVAAAVTVGAGTAIRYAVAMRSGDTEPPVTEESSNIETQDSSKDLALLTDANETQEEVQENSEVQESGLLESTVEEPAVLSETTTEAMSETSTESMEETESESTLRPVSMSDECAEAYYDLMQAYFNKKHGFGDSMEFWGYYGEQDLFGRNLDPHFALVDLDGTGNPELFICPTREDFGADEIVMYTPKNTEYSVYANHYDSENGDIVSAVGFGATIYKLENDEMSIICDIYTPVDGDMLGTITYSDGTVEEIPFERQIEINAEIDSLPRPPIAEDYWIPMNPETVEEYFGTR